MERGVGTLASPRGCGETPAKGGQCPHYYAKCVFMVMASIISHFLENREVQLARQEVMDSIRTSIEQSTMNVGTTIGTDAMQSITNLGTDLGAYLKQLPMRYWPIAQENHAMRALHAMHPNAE